MNHQTIVRVARSLELIYRQQIEIRLTEPFDKHAYVDRLKARSETTKLLVEALIPYKGCDYLVVKVDGFIYTTTDGVNLLRINIKEVKELT